MSHFRSKIWSRTVASWLPGGHAILLVQYSDRSNSRTYSEHDTVSRAMDDICQMYEQAMISGLSLAHDVAVVKLRS
eukprot:g8115.t1